MKRRSIILTARGFLAAKVKEAHDYDGFIGLFMTRMIYA